MLRSIAHISYYTNTQHVIQNWAGYMRNRYFSLEPILAHSAPPPNCQPQKPSFVKLQKSARQHCSYMDNNYGLFHLFVLCLNAKYVGVSSFIAFQAKFYAKPVSKTFVIIQSGAFTSNLPPRGQIKAWMMAQYLFKYSNFLVESTTGEKR